MTIPIFAQVTINENFDAGNGVFSGTYFTSATEACNVQSTRDNIFNTSNGDLTSTNQVGASNGADLDIQFDYKIVDWSAATNPTPPGWGSAEVQYSVDAGVTWTTVLTIDDANHVTANTCATMMATVPAASLPTGSDVQVRILNTWVAGDYYFYIDDFSAIQISSTAPNCDAALTTPVNGDIDVDIDTDLTWSTPTGGPTGYFLSVGTSTGGT